MGIRELMQDAVEPIAPPPAGRLIAAARFRVRRRRIRCAAVGGGVAVLLVAAGLGIGYRHAPPSTPTPTPAAAALPARPVGTAARISPSCRPGGCVWILTVASGARFRLPGPRAKDDLHLHGAGISPDGRWIAYNDGHRSVLRDLTGTTTYRVAGSGPDTTPNEWSQNGRWVMLTIGAGYRNHLRVDLTTGATDRVRPAALRYFRHFYPDFPVDLYTLTGSGDLVEIGAGEAPSRAPRSDYDTTVARGTLYVVDPVTAHLIRTVSVSRLVPYEADEVDGKLAWGADTPPMTVRSDDRYLVTMAADWGTDLTFVDLATGHIRQVSAPVPPTAEGEHYQLTRYTDHELVLLGESVKLTYTAAGTALVDSQGGVSRSADTLMPGVNST
jgi:hypothetical protein